MTMPQWVDSHAHLTMLGDGDAIAAAIDRAAAAGVGGVLVPATNGDDLAPVLELARHFPGRVVVAAGVHPHDAARLDDALKRRLEQAVTAPGVVAVGEIGLDYHYMSSPREDQIAALAWQLDLALAADRPVVLHNRESWPDLFRLLEERAPRLRGVAHSFTEGPDEARAVVDLGLVVGISGMVTFKAADNIRSMAAALAPGEVLVETDSPFLAPVPHRGKPNQPAFVPLVGAGLAAVLGVAAAELAATTSATFRRLFRLGPEWPRPE